MPTSPFVPIIICGGSGSRLWPHSRATLPKPFIVLPGQPCSLIDATYARLQPTQDGVLQQPAAVITVTASDYAFLCEESFEKHGGAIEHIIIGEPCGRNTAAAIAVGSAIARQRFGDDVVLAVLPADHLITPAPAFQRCLADACHRAQEGTLTLLGIPPGYPATAYGYIECDATASAGTALAVRRFVEKPDLATATKFVQQGNFLWNAGIFCFRAVDGLDALATHAPAISRQLPTILAEWKTSDTGRPFLPSAECYEQLPNISFDYAVMEKITNAAAVPASALTWSDIGSWRAQADLLTADDSGNRMVGDVRVQNCQNSFFVGEQRLVVGIGLDGVHVIDTPDALLVAAAEQSEQVREVFEDLRAQGREEALTPNTVRRPWGSYTVLSEGKGYKVKRIDVSPGAQLSLQSHQKRSEHWTTIVGTMTVVIDEREFAMPVNHSCHVPLGAKHRMKNLSDTNAAIIEVQIGDYLGEDDITRYEDVYGRA